MLPDIFILVNKDFHWPGSGKGCESYSLQQDFYSKSRQASPQNSSQIYAWGFLRKFQNAACLEFLNLSFVTSSGALACLHPAASCDATSILQQL